MDYTVTPWNVEGTIDYERLVKEFGTQLITDDILDKIKRHAKYLHPLLKLGYFFSHRDLDWILDKYEQGEKFYLYTGRGPSGNIHLGHILPWIFTKYLQDAFDANLLFQITDDEKFLYNDEKSMDEISKYTYENLLDIIAIGFDEKKTKIIIDSKHIAHLYPIVLEISKKITFSTIKATFGFDNSTNIGMILFPAIQAAPCFLPSHIEGKPTPCLIPAAIDQDPYWRITRDIATKLGYYKPAQIHSRFVPGLGMHGKMSSSKPETAIFTVDDEDIIKTKITNSFTGGQATVKLQRMLGGNPNNCPVFWYLRYMFENEKRSDERYIRCKGGELLCYECKQDLINSTIVFINDFKKKREKAKDLIDRYMF